MFPVVETGFKQSHFPTIKDLRMIKQTRRVGRESRAPRLQPADLDPGGPAEPALLRLHWFQSEPCTTLYYCCKAKL